jgi:hypothetical protein
MRVFQWGPVSLTTLVYNINCQSLNRIEIYEYIHARYNNDKTYD